MIPIALPPASFYLFLGLSLLAGVAVLAWLAMLALSSKMRQRFKRRPWLSGGSMALLALAASFFIGFQYDMWQMEREFARREAARRVTLAQPQTLGGVAMPAGTRLVLGKPDDRESHTEASFNAPTPVFGVQAMRFIRYLDPVRGADSDKRSARRAHTVHVWGQGVQQLEGWRCDLTHKVELRAPDGSDQPVFDACTLAAGNRIDGIDLPAGAEVRSRDGERYTNGHVEPLRWFVTIQGENPISIRGLILGRPGLKLDEQRRLTAIDGAAALACPLRLGPMDYPAGTLVQSLGYPMKRQAPDAWVFSPANGNAARREGGDDVPDGMSVVQNPDGKVLDVVPNARAGVMRFAVIVEHESQIPKPIKCPQ